VGGSWCPSVGWAKEYFFRRTVLIQRIKSSASSLKREIYALAIVVRDPRVPWFAKLFLGLVLAYAFSPIDLIPDFVPVLGYLDDLIIVPLGIAIALRMIPPQVIIDARKQAGEILYQAKPINPFGAFIVIVIWLAVIFVTLFVVFHLILQKI
jgi:uncharacterized membrane protein YkvA (DUF1232 family)